MISWVGGKELIRWEGDEGTRSPVGGLLGSQSREGALGPGWGDSGSLQGGRDGDKCCIPLPACWHLDGDDDGDDDGDTMVMGDDDDAFLRQLLLIFTDACFTSIQQISILRWAWHCKPKRLSKHIGTKMVERMSLLISERVKDIDYFCLQVFEQNNYALCSEQAFSRSPLVKVCKKCEIRYLTLPALPTQT